ncbi:UNVERIFIED_ORG: 4-hydroxy-tetrahydrodipicolinate synthase [Methylobacterium sp. SuP10 SLI 274]|uniref:dihydrodipicolinate synthase family protein n=1 Tax=Methylorubrum extorquens TaxID=408 RepID=UPI00209F44AB|nr:dihydrodipicolinate synthase family protein [Methylorubrum extorquens]MDF9861986.1 4-hydroxy-tetrahydrodipicolinate synthase [Methylorubrum pseudosasae]MDH6635602.1 4-hydroxy-tetrahydrodipicolinate synthase [Methylobacterium sp. SuP10 SLI 274]MDH6664778.1 4-hydroxy-tetrahydrodipicolinate synthase [Methylorubrum zatmanii]MCP1561774.1 4-hydroxy-tetrahydrodipicolinate synthase [Methylorubrum extorquens]MDF9790280.1 4-hydroxy-tetrahydrodipicolinate synthase [Methylorubrum extorquens]
MTCFTGLSAFPITPASPDGRVDPAALRALIAPLAAAGVDSIGLLGSTGTYAYLSRAERRRALDAALDEVGGRVPVIVGIGALRTDEAVALAQDARAAGAAAGLLAAISYTPLTDEEVFEHFSAIATDSGLPICIYDNPGTTHFRFTPSLVGRLAQVPGIRALKSPAPDSDAVAGQLDALRRAVPAEFRLGFSGDWNAAEAVLAGGEAWYSVAAGLFPEPCLAILRAARAGEAARARALNARMQPLWDLFKEFSSLRVTYAAAHHLGLCRTDPPRPILPLSETVRNRVAEVVDRLALA